MGTCLTGCRLYRNIHSDIRIATCGNCSEHFGKHRSVAGVRELKKPPGKNGLSGSWGGDLETKALRTPGWPETLVKSQVIGRGGTKIADRVWFSAFRTCFDLPAQWTIDFAASVESYLI